MSGEKSTNDLIKDLISSVAALQKDVTALKRKEDDHQKRKRLCEENEEEHEADANRDGERHVDRQNIAIVMLMRQSLGTRCPQRANASSSLRKAKLSSKTCLAPG